MWAVRQLRLLLFWYAIVLWSSSRQPRLVVSWEAREQGSLIRRGRRQWERWTASGDAVRCTHKLLFLSSSIRLRKCDTDKGYLLPKLDKHILNKFSLLIYHCITGKDGILRKLLCWFARILEVRSLIIEWLISYLRPRSPSPSASLPTPRARLRVRLLSGRLHHQGVSSMSSTTILSAAKSAN